MNTAAQKKYTTGVDAWERRLSKIEHDSEFDVDLSFLETISDEPIRDEFVRLPYEDPSPRTSYQSAIEVEQVLKVS